MPSGSDLPLYYWETSIWITYFNHGTQHPDVYERIVEMVTLLKQKRIRVITSVLTRIELLEIHNDPKVLRDYDAQLDRRNVNDASITREIASLASIFRSHFPSLRSGKKLADAIHLATAVAAVADEMHTTDGSELLKCNGDPILRGTAVIRPISDSPNLFTGVPRIGKEPS